MTVPAVPKATIAPEPIASVPISSRWPTLDAAAYHGLAGEIVDLIDPHTESDPVAILAQTLTAFGNAIGRNAHFLAESRAHYTNINIVLTGDTAKGRKGSSWSNVKRLFGGADESWTKTQIAHGLSSGEGLIWRVHDAIHKTEEIKEKGRGTGEYADVLVDPGIADKRVLVIEEEYSQVLAVMTRQGNTLSPVIRQAWDTGDLATMTKNSPAVATGAHISIVGHITKDEMLRNLTATESANGFANRFAFFAVRRSKLLPDGGNLTDVALEPVALKLCTAVEFGRFPGLIRRDRAATELWHAEYASLSEGKAGLLGAICARAEAQTMRFATIYAVLDRSDQIKVPHLQAAMALWHYSEASAKWIFGSTLGDPVADTILDALRRAPNGLTRTDISALFGRHRQAREIDNGLASLVKQQLAHALKEPSENGRPAERWFAGHA